MEWRLSVSAAEGFLQTLSSDVYITCTYSEFVEDSEACMARILEFLSLNMTAEVSRFISNNISYRHSADMKKPTEEELAIGGRVLEASLPG